MCVSVFFAVYDKVIVNVVADYFYWLQWRIDKYRTNYENANNMPCRQFCELFDFIWFLSIWKRMGSEKIQENSRKFDYNGKEISKSEVRRALSNHSKHTKIILQIDYSNENLYYILFNS